MGLGAVSATISGAAAGVARGGWGPAGEAGDDAAREDARSGEARGVDGAERGRAVCVEEGRT